MANSQLGGPGVLASLQHAEALCELRRYADAVPLLRALVASDPAFTVAWCQLGVAYLGVAQHELALGAAAQAISVGDVSEWPHRIASLAYSSLGRHADAVRSARHSVRLAPQELAPHVRLADALSAASGGCTEALTVARHAVGLAPAQPRAHRAVGDAAAAAGDRALARQAYAEALRLDPHDVASRNNLALVQLRSGELAEAAEGFTSSAALDPTMTTSRLNLDATLWRMAYQTVRVQALGVALCAVALSGTVGVAWPQGAAGLLGLVTAVAVTLLMFGYLRRLPPGARRYLHTVPRRRPAMALCAGGVACSAVLLLIGAVDELVVGVAPGADDGAGVSALVDVLEDAVWWAIAPLLIGMIAWSAGIVAHRRRLRRT